ncbi:hypothetical protein AAKU67_003158 [Oxalobacteraceae bacterium GrIS 2.11]
MEQAKHSNSVWKITTTLLVLAAFCSIMIELTYSIGPMSSGQVGSLGAKFDCLVTRYPCRIESIDPASPLLAAGAVLGDTVILDHSGTLFNRSFQVGESVELTSVHAGSARHLLLDAVAEPMSFISYFHKISDMVVSVVAGIFALLIVYKIPNLKTYRALTLFFLFQALNCDFKLAPTGFLHVLTDLTSWGTSVLIPYFCLRFVLFYPEDQPQGMRAALVQKLPAINLIAFLFCVLQLWRLIIDHPVGKLVNLVFQGYYLLFLGLIIVSLFDGYRHSLANGRQKYLWLIISLCIPFIISTFSVILNGPTERSVMTVTYEASLLLMEIGTIYAVLKHRGLNFSFAINRAIFYSASTLILLISFVIIEWLSEKVVHIEGRESNVVLDGAIALGVYLIFHKIRHYLEHYLEQLFFHGWHVNEIKLREFVRIAVHITSEDALLQALCVELKRFSGGATCSIFLRNDANDYDCVSANETDGCKSIGVNDRLCVALRADLKPILAGNDDPLFSQTTVFPMSHRGDLSGIVILGEKGNGEEYRPDEIALLSHAIHQAGLDLLALRTEQMENKNRDLQREIATMQQMISQISGNWRQFKL